MDSKDTSERKELKEAVGRVSPKPEDILSDSVLFPSFQCYVSQHLFEVPVTIGGIKTMALLDSGASVNMVNEEVGDVLKASGCESQAAGCGVRVANGSVVRPKSKVYADLAVDGRPVDDRAAFLIMPDLPYSVVIGLKFLKDHHTSLVFGPESNRLVIGEQVYESHIATGSADSEITALVAVKQRINARSEAVVRVKVPGAKNGRVYVISGLESLTCSGLCAGITMSTAKDGCLLLRVANRTTSHLTLKSQRPVGMVDLVDYVSGPISARNLILSVHLLLVLRPLT
jgi:hypothetical protein